MSKSIVYPYGITLREIGIIDVFPAVEVGFLSKESEWLSLFLLVDSGATISALPKSDASALGVDVESGKAAHVSGISGEAIMGWTHEISIKLGENILRVPFVFLDFESAPRVLGRVGVFDKFTIIFEELDRRTGFLNSTNVETKSVSRVLDKFST